MVLMWSVASHVLYPSMADYELWYFVEGHNFKSQITISKEKYVADLKEEIHGQATSGF